MAKATFVIRAPKLLYLFLFKKKQKMRKRRQKKKLNVEEGNKKVDVRWKPLFLKALKMAIE
jgi:hypothetical protein